MLPLQSPLEAYRADLSRHPNRTDFGRSDTVWLLVAHCLHRLSRAQGDARRAIAENCASAIGDLAATVAPDTPEEAAMLQQLRLRRGLPAIDAKRTAGDVVGSARILADQMSDAGALWLAYSTLGHVRLAATVASGAALAATLLCHTIYGFIAVITVRSRRSRFAMPRRWRVVSLGRAS